MARPAVSTTEEKKQFWKDYVRQYRKKQRKRRERDKYIANVPNECRVHKSENIVPPEDVVAERDRLREIQLTPSQEILGDPLPGRSALDRRMRELT